MEVSKQCKSCKQVKPIEDYYAHPDSKDGRTHLCKECTKLQRKGYRPKHKTVASKTSEQSVIDILRNQGIYAAPGKCSEWNNCDVVAWGCVRIEVKSSNKNKKGAFLFSATSRQRKHGFIADLVVLICDWKDTKTYHLFPASHPIFYVNGKMKQGFFYDPYTTMRKSGRGGRITNALMNEQKDRWDLVEIARLKVMDTLQGKQSLVPVTVTQPTLFDVAA